MRQTFDIIPYDGPLGCTNLRVEIMQRAIESRDFAHGAGCAFDWFNDRLQLLIHDGVGDDPIMHVRLNRDGSLDSVVVRDDVMPKVQAEGPSLTLWMEERDNRPAPLKVDYKLFSRDTLRIRVPENIDESDFNEVIERCGGTDGVQYLARNCTVNGDVFRAFMRRECPQPDTAVYRFLNYCATIDCAPDDYFFYR